MKARNFSLKIFPGAIPQPDFLIKGSITRFGDTIGIHYAAEGRLSEIDLPAAVRQPIRQNKLWQSTCFELFVGEKESDDYWEFNFSPLGHWNVFKFQSYRRGMAEEPAFDSFPLCIHKTPSVFQLSTVLELQGILPPEQSLKLGVSAVIRDIHGGLTYWAVVHPRQDPDFHSQESFVIEM